jgi:nucleolar protein 56
MSVLISIFMIIFTHITGCYVFDETGGLKDKKEFTPEEALNYAESLVKLEWLDVEKEFAIKYPDSVFLGFKSEKYELCKLTQDPKKITMISGFLAEIFDKTRQYNTVITKQKVKACVQNDNLIIQTINNIDEIVKITNLLAKRVREWYELYNPEISRSVADHEKFVELITEKTKLELLTSINLKPELSMGAEIGELNVKPILELAKELKSLYVYKKNESDYLETLMNVTCPNVTAITGALLGARLLALAGSLTHLVELPSSTIQLLGAEKALFRHIRTGARAPKHGILIEHPLVMTAENKGRAARMFANKISIAAKIDFYKGAFIGDKLKKDLEEKLKK